MPCRVKYNQKNNFDVYLKVWSTVTTLTFPLTKVHQRWPTEINTRHRCGFHPHRYVFHSWASSYCHAHLSSPVPLIHWVHCTLKTNHSCVMENKCTWVTHNMVECVVESTHHFWNHKTFHTQQRSKNTVCPETSEGENFCEFYGYLQKFLCEIWGMVSFGTVKASNSRKLSPRKSYFSPIR